MSIKRLCPSLPNSQRKAATPAQRRGRPAVLARSDPLSEVFPDLTLPATPTFSDAEPEVQAESPVEVEAGPVATTPQRPPKTSTPPLPRSSPLSPTASDGRWARCGRSTAKQTSCAAHRCGMPTGSTPPPSKRPLARPPFPWASGFPVAPGPKAGRSGSTTWRPWVALTGSATPPISVSTPRLPSQSCSRKAHSA